MDERPSFSDIFEGHFLRVYRYFRIRVGEDEEARDLTSETFLRVFEHLPSYDTRYGSYEPWLFRIARNLLTDEYRRSERSPSLVSIEDHQLVASADSPEEVLEDGELMADVNAAIEFLAPRERDVIALKFGGGLSNEEIGDIHRITSTNTAVILHRAIKKLRALLVPEESGDG